MVIPSMVNRFHLRGLSNTQTRSLRVGELVTLYVSLPFNVVLASFFIAEANM